MDINSFTEKFQYVSIFVAYVLCCVFMYKPNTEYVCFILFLVLHIIFLILFFSSGVGMGNMVRVLPFELVIWNGYIPISMIFIIGWILELVANSILIQTYRVLHSTFGTVGKPVDLGDPKNYNLKDNLKKTMIISTFFLSLLFTFNNNSNLLIVNPKSRIDKIFNQIIKSKNNILVIITVGTLVFSSLSVYFAQILGGNTKTIATPPQ